MKNKHIFVSTITRSSIIFVFLLWLIGKNQNILSRMMILPFLLCSAFLVAKNICFMLDKKKLAMVFSKLFIVGFLLFWFGILIYVNYIFIKNGEYFSLLFTLPFWLVGIYVTCKYLLGMKSKVVHDNKKLKVDFNIAISVFLVFSVLIIGIGCLYFGIRDTVRLHKKTKGYLITDGYYKDYNVYNVDSDGKTTYQLNYAYVVDGIEYRVSTEYGVGLESIPKFDSTREVRYDSNDHSKAILAGTNQSHYLIYFGAFFTLGGSIFVFAALYIKGVFDKVKFNVMGTHMGIVCTMIGIGIILFQNGMTSSFIETIKTMKFWILVPILLIISGIYLTIKSLFLDKQN